jgi:dolichyl-phosphate beta-glucosyltransferase
MPEPSTTLVVPCYNEASRLDVSAFRGGLEALPFLRLVFVDDGSRDRTRQVLEQFTRAHDRAAVLVLDQNVGKGEAVRRGVLVALADSPSWVGYWDADLSTPLEALRDFLALGASLPGVDIILGSRVKILGRTIERRLYRHYIGRFYATAASLTLGLPVYDTQCGAKLFRVNARTRALFERPFGSRWVFDVELLERYLDGRVGDAAAAEGIYELALKEWRHSPGSKVRVSDAFRSAFDLWRIYRQRQR